MKEITYHIEVDTDVDDRKIKNWHKNILKYGTITNTLMKAFEINGEMQKAKDL